MVSRFKSAVSLLLLSSLLVASPAIAQTPFDSATLKCRAAVAKAGTKLAKVTLKELTACHKKRGKDAALAATDCNSSSTGDLNGKIAVAEGKFAATLAARCTGVCPGGALFESCPSPCDDEVPAISTFADVASCLVCLERDSAERFAGVGLRAPAPPLGELAPCHQSLGKAGSKLFHTVLKTIGKCQARAEKSGGTSTEVCASTDILDLVLQTRAAIRGGRCADSSFPQPSLDACGETTTLEALAACVADAAGDPALELAGHLLELDETAAPSTTTTTTTTTTTLAPSAAQCPGSAQLRSVARDTRDTCTTNDDCAAPRTCQSGACRGSGGEDLGWTGFAHRKDENDGSLLAVDLSCPGPADPTCGGCAIGGVDPSAGNCRCSNDPRVVCSEPFAAGPECGRSCVGGPSDGDSCSEDDDCAADLCQQRCLGNDTIACTGDAQCPGDHCGSVLHKTCSDGSICSTDSDCVVTCVGAGTCQCYAATPTPVSIAGTPACLIDTLEEGPTGSLDADSGAMSLSLAIRRRYYPGASVVTPCPTCGGTCSNAPSSLCDRDEECPGGTCNLDPTPGDGLRGGTCTGGANVGASCDVQGRNATFPVYVDGSGGGGGYSLDCMPGSPSFGAGHVLRLVETTSTSQLDASLSCGGLLPDENCPCLTCNSDPTIPCSSDAECAHLPSFCSAASQTQRIACSSDADCETADAGPCVDLSGPDRCQKALSVVCESNSDCVGVDAGTCEAPACTSVGLGVNPAPNECGGLVCNDLGGEQGECDIGELSYCDGILQADGRGILLCGSDSNCGAGALGFDAGLCALTEKHRCFLDPIVASGTAHPTDPVLAAATCAPPQGNQAINDTLGLPGPVRRVRQLSLTMTCEGGSSPYTPGVGGCP